MFNLFKKSRKNKVISKCGCVCYCPECHDILNDQAECTDLDEVTYMFKMRNKKCVEF